MSSGLTFPRALPADFLRFQRFRGLPGVEWGPLRADSQGLDEAPPGKQGGLPGQMEDLSRDRLREGPRRSLPRCSSSILVWTGSSALRGSQKHPLYSNRAFVTAILGFTMATKASIPLSRAHRSPLAAISADYDLELEKIIEYDQCQPKLRLLRATRTDDGVHPLGGGPLSLPFSRVVA